MFAICVEASHAKGMGHLYRMLNFAKYIKKQNQSFLFIINYNEKSKKILTEQNIKYEVVNLDDYSSGWETNIINKYGVKYWINDRLKTDQRHANNIKKNNKKLITCDDLGSGAKNSDINVCGLFFNRNNLQGKKILSGVDYLILNSEIEIYKKKRVFVENILVTMGGSDTYGVTVKIVELLKANNIKATVHIGPSFKHGEALNNIITDEYRVIKNIPSLIEEFTKYDLAITGGGITPFEANASGLPCLIVANEYIEISNGEFLQKIGSSKFIGYHDDINANAINDINFLDIRSMSSQGINNITTGAVNEIYNNIMQL